MNNSKTPKIVVGVGLAAIYAAGYAFLTMRDGHDNVVADTAPTAVVADPAPTAQVAAEPVAPSAIDSVSNDSSTSLAAASPVQKSAVEKSAPSSEVTSAGHEPASGAGDAPPSVQSETAPAANDSQITADVKSQLAAVALPETIDVATKDGVVELTGSVPSEEVMDKARLTARNVAAVRYVDVSALTISN